MRRCTTRRHDDPVRNTDNANEYATEFAGPGGFSEEEIDSSHSCIAQAGSDLIGWCVSLIRSSRAESKYSEAPVVNLEDIAVFGLTGRGITPTNFRSYAVVNSIVLFLAVKSRYSTHPFAVADRKVATYALRWVSVYLEAECGKCSPHTSQT